jgi:hypothetical protein
MAEDPAKKGKVMTAGGSAASESPSRESERLTEAKLVPMGQSKHALQRRGQRVYLRAPVVVYGQRPDGTFYSENTHTLIVSANGALVLLAAEFKSKERLILVNSQSMKECECYVASFGEPKEGKREVGIGFVEPCPNFWGLTFPPEDWDPAKRKLPNGRAR